MGFSTRVALAGSLLAASLVEATPYYGNYGSVANTTAGHVVYTTEVVTALTTYCPAATTLTYNDKTYTISTATTLTITDCPCTISKPVAPTTSTTPKDECAEGCYTAYNKCRGQPNANMATCAAGYASCLGYNPFGGDGSLITPTACSKTASATGPVYTTEVVTAITTYCPEPTTLTYNNMTYTVTKPTTFTITNCPCTVTKPSVPTSAVPTSPAATCPQMCTDAYNKCRGQAGANMATCAAGYASCLGYSPFDSNGSLVTPTACSAGSSATHTVPGSATGTAPVSVPTTPVPVPASGAAGLMAPGAIVLALGALIMV
ncbi:hypothetical protein BGZ61DRAFT_592454 [Ilyonectria robusta]|uniref:uncharacterized protein n=1 Tax=Ilyonectria robusta TaxID=1079257 RepID=UPI001E8E7BF3|nr:uncharacterized protein BGZ61DRAFT_592454 [Ilyonectria robusta]KAH8669382.1 hypothetical protein BGZ61DRAFT_592454 [Ilyonectria robusta]